MSFILDALKKSESERQQQSGAEFASVPTSSAEPRRSHWFWLLGLLLAVNLAVLVGILLRSASEPAVVVGSEALAPAVSETSSAGVEARQTFADQIATARQDRPEPVPVPSRPETTVATESAPLQQPVAVTSKSPLPTIDQLRLEGSTDLPELRVDIHVYSENPAERFVFINMNKLREKSQLPEGPVIRTIRPDGVELEFRGRNFLLPRE